MNGASPVALVRPEIVSPLDGWSWYGAHQLLEVAGVPFAEMNGDRWRHGEWLGARVVVVPNVARPKRLVGVVQAALRAGKLVIVGCDLALALLQDGMDIGAEPLLPIPLPPTEPSELLPLTAHALLPVSFMDTALPLLGEPILFSVARPVLGTIQTKDGRKGALAWVKRIGDGNLIVIGGRLFETCGLLLSRFSWFAHPHRRDSFLNRVDPLWDEHLTAWHQVPVVSLYARYLAWLLSVVLWERGEILPLRWCLPHQDDNPFRMALTALHDVEIVFENPTWKRADNPCYCFPRWLDLEEQLGVQSAFYFLAPVTVPPHWQTNYALTDEAVQGAMELIERRGGEIGLLSMGHVSESVLAMEREQLEDVGGVFVWGVRSYRFGNTPASARHKAAVGFTYDVSWFAGQSQPSFLTGCAHLFRPLDAERWRVLSLVELSAVLDDRVVFGEFADRPRANDEAVGLGVPFCEAVLALNGTLGLSWQQHSGSAMSERAMSWITTFERLVRHCRQVTDGAIWCPAPKEIAEWWTIRGEVRVHWRSVAERQWQVEVALPEEAVEPIAFVLALPAPQPLRVQRDKTLMPIQPLTSLGQNTLWGVPLILEPEEPLQLVVQAP